MIHRYCYKIAEWLGSSTDFQRYLSRHECKIYVRNSVWGESQSTSY